MSYNYDHIRCVGNLGYILNDEMQIAFWSEIWLFIANLHTHASFPLAKLFIRITQVFVRNRLIGFKSQKNYSAYIALVRRIAAMLSKLSFFQGSQKDSKRVEKVGSSFIYPLSILLLSVTYPFAISSIIYPFSVLALRARILGRVCFLTTILLKRSSASLLLDLMAWFFLVLLVSTMRPNSMRSLGSLPKQIISR